jgi:hypothetical protein
VCRNAHDISEFLEKKVIENSDLSNYAMINKWQRERKLQCDVLFEGETKLDSHRSIRINTYFVIIYSIFSEMDKQRLAYKNHNAKIGCPSKLPEMEPLYVWHVQICNLAIRMT